MQKVLAIVALLASASALAAGVEFLSPLPGAQVIGVQVIEVRTSVAGVNRVEFFVDGAMAGVARQAPWRVAYDFGTITTARRITAKAWSNNYRAVESADVVTTALNAAQTIDIDVVEVPVRIRANRAVRASDLRIRENGKEQAIREVLAQRGAAHFAFVVDRSLSMNNGRLAAALLAIDAARTMLRPGDTASLVLFNHNVSKAQQLAPADKVSARLGDVVPSGGTSLRDALASIASEERTYAIVITDGGDRNSVLSEASAIEKISGTKTVVNAIVLGSPSRFLERAASTTGGSLLRAGTPTIAPQLRAIIADINSRYVAIYQSSGGKRGWRTLAVSGRRGAEVVSARKGYFAR